jgi:hypothetical protein
LEGGPPIFRQDGSCPALLKDRSAGFPYGAVTRYGSPFQTLPVPNRQTTGLVRFRSPLLAESRLMSFPPATEMFQFAGFASRTYEFSTGYPPSCLGRVGCPIRRSRDHQSLASPPGFSQRATSFIASQCQGIHQMPFLCSIHQRRPAPALASPKRRPGTPPRTGASPNRTRPARPLEPFGSRPARPQHPQAPRPQRGASHEDTSSDGPIRKSAPASRGPSASVTFTNSLHPINQHRPRSRRRRRGTLPPGRPGPRNETWSSPNADSQERG